MKLFCNTILLIILLTLIGGCASGPRIDRGAFQIAIETTAYCPCQKCCGWTTNEKGQPIFGSGHLKGKLKKIGVCADGTQAVKGTLAADTRYYPFNTRMYIPGYGFGEVHDRGSAIQGPHRLDLYFPTHQEALNWGRRTLLVTIYRK